MSRGGGKAISALAAVRCRADRDEHGVAATKGDALRLVTSLARQVSHQDFLFTIRLELSRESVTHDPVIQGKVQVTPMHLDIVPSRGAKAGSLVRFSISIEVPEGEHTAGRVAWLPTQSGIQVTIWSHCKLPDRTEVTRHHCSAETLG
jgi:hypothetical protein